MPAGLEKLAEVERLVSAEGSQAVDLYLKSAIEGVVIKWASLVHNVVAHEPSAAFDNGQNPTPNVELEYWSARLANLRCEANDGFFSKRPLVTFNRNFQKGKAYALLGQEFQI